MHSSGLRGLASLCLTFALANVGLTLADSSGEALVPITRPLRATPRTQAAIPRVAMAETPPSLPAKEIAPVPADLTPQDGEACGDGAACKSYYRNRPRGCHADRIKLQNRLGEPQWYHYYRCVHFGYHPTQWHAWPDGWLTCRHPQPGKHPYDIERPKPDKRILDRERRLQGDRSEPDLLDEPLPRNPADPLRELPAPQNTTPSPILTPGQNGPSSVPDVPNPIVR